MQRIIRRIPPRFTNTSRLNRRTVVILSLALTAMVLFGSGAVLRILLTHEIPEYARVDESVTVAVPPFPIGVDPERELIVENPEVHTFYETYIEHSPIAHTRMRGWFGEALAFITQSSVLQNLASPVSRTLVIRPGDRREEVVQSFGDILRWDARERSEFLTQVSTTSPSLQEGKFYPGTYLVSRTATSGEVAKLVTDRFENEVLVRYTDEIERVVPLEKALTIASLLEREAYDFTDMREISGILWNRLFADMKLQLDASLQYAKVSPSSKNWWPRVVPRDKYIDSPYNTYKNEGLPPTPIANPSIESIVAALNPAETSCMYYFHDRRGKFYCSETYEEHVAGLKKVYGQGR